MATFPDYIKILIGVSEQPKPVVLRSEMERGVPKQRRIASDTMVSVPATLLFETPDAATAFETWFYGDAGGGANFFTWTDPRTNTTVQARIVGGDIGALQPASGVWNGMCTRRVTFEYLRSAY